MKTKLIATLALLSTLNAELSTLHAQGTAFTYQGRLNDGTNPASGSYDMQFYLRDAVTAGNPVGSTNTLNGATPVVASNGLFTVTLDFGSTSFLLGSPRWLEIGVRTNGSASAYTTLSPRQTITPTPYAITAHNLSGTLGAGQLIGVIPTTTLNGANGSGLNSLNASQLTSGTVPSARLSGTYGSAVTLSNAGNSFTGNGAGLTGLVAANLTGNLPAGFGTAGDFNVAGALTVDNSGQNSGAVNPGLTFGYASGEGISSQRTSGGNQYGLDLYTSFTPRLSITGGGNVGIGTTTPAAMLDIQGGAETTGANDLHDIALSFRSGGYRHWISSRHNSATTGNAIDFYLNTNGASDGSSAPGIGNAQILTLANQGVGIGKTNPASALDVNGTATATAFSGDGAGLTGLDGGHIKNNTITALKIDTTIALWAKGQVVTSPMYTALNGISVGIGTNNPQSTLHVVGTVTADNFIATAAAGTEPPSGVTPILAMVWIKPGTFIMGSPTSESFSNPNERPQTVVTISKGFWMGHHEVTQGEYQTVMGSNPSFFTGDLNLPVETVRWSDATNYCRLLTQGERTAGRLPAGWGYRLPTEAEWEYACRAWTTTIFSYGDDPGFASLTNYAWYSDNSSSQTHPVGKKLANPWGLVDMYGNVGEWCQDWYAPIYDGGSVTDPTGPATGTNRVFRGGDWIFVSFGCRSAARGANDPTVTYSYIGFRVVLAPGQP